MKSYYIAQENYIQYCSGKEYTKKERLCITESLGCTVEMCTLRVRLQ